ncbi:MAG TPA: DegT/DnrJ/EryC1/StrS family aminotransferase [Patescibacteria group bacterium]|nr:DegT/DnrJ/EryC1/StrS family aminotransferase [Patescibacteria group bacterium]
MDETVRCKGGTIKLKRSKKPIAFAGPWITDKEVAYTTDATRNGFYETRLTYARKLEKTVATYIGMPYALATHCCTLALHLSCAAIGLKKGDEVICTDLSWIATADAIAYTGANPVFVDIDPATWCIDPEHIERAITRKTKAIMIVHMFGHPCRMDEIMAIAKKHHLRVIEDAAPALGSEYKGKRVGGFGDFGCFSFHGAKIAVSGEGGILLTKNKTLYDRAALLGSMGRTDRKAQFWCDEIGYQYTIANLTAALATAQVERIGELMAKKRQLFKWYERGLDGIEGITLMKEQKDCTSNYCYPGLMVHPSVKISRDRIIQKLGQANIFCRPMFPRMSLMPMYEARYKNPEATKASKYGINLPSAGNLTEEDIDFVCRTFKKIIGVS